VADRGTRVLRSGNTPVMASTIPSALGRVPRQISGSPLRPIDARHAHDLQVHRVLAVYGRCDTGDALFPIDRCRSSPATGYCMRR